MIDQDPHDPHFVADPYQLYARLHQHDGPVFWKNYGFRCLSGFNSVNQVLRDKRFTRIPPDNHSSSPWPKSMQNFAIAERYSLLNLEPPQHTRIRKVINHAFLSKAISRLKPWITQQANNCIDQFENRQSVELLSEYATPIPLLVITKLLGVPQSQGHRLLEWSHAMVRVYTQQQTPEETQKAEKAAEQFIEFLKQLISCKRHKKDDGLIAQLLHDDSHATALSDDELISNTILLLNAGHEATVHQLGNAVYTLLLTYPLSRRNELISLLANDRTANAVVTECLRFCAPLHLFTRFAQSDITLEANVKVHRGEQIGLLLAAANRCPAKFRNPNTFDPMREDTAHLSLGAGLHFCLGAQLARLELLVALQVLFDRLPGLELASKPQYQDAWHFHGLVELPLRW